MKNVPWFLFRDRSALTAVLGVVVLGLTVSLTAQSNREIPIGVFDLGPALDQCHKFQDALNDTRSKQAAAQKALDERIEAYTQELQALEPQLEMLSEQRKREKQAEFQRKRIAIMEDGKQQFDDLIAYKDQLLEPLLEQLDGVVERIAVREGLAIVVKRSALRYAGSAYDITDLVIEEYNKLP